MNSVGKGSDIGFGLCVGDHDHGLNARYFPDYFFGLLQGIVTFAIIIISIRRKENFGLDLPETIQNPFDPKVWRTRGPHRADAGHGQHRYYRLHHIGHKTGNPIPDGHTRLTQGLSEPRHLIIEFGIAHASSGRALPFEDQSGLFIPKAQQVFSKIQFSPDKPTGLEHILSIGQNLRIRLGSFNLPKFPDRSPECGGFLNRPRVQFGIILKG